MKTKITTLLWVLLLAGIVQSCKKDPDPDPDPGNEIPASVLKTNEWIYENMSLYYFWTSFMPEIDRTKEADSEAYFNKLLHDEDQWSTITPDYKKLEGELSGEPTSMGFHPKFYRLGEANVFIVVSYVYPGSPAALAGLKRGDIILTLNNNLLTMQNYYDEYSATNYSVQTGKIEGPEGNQTLVPTGVSVDLSAKVIQADPAIHNEVIEINGHKIGYLVYVGFISGDNNKYLTTLDNIFNAFKAEGITDLVVDLRYNPGGDINAASHLASAIAPASAGANADILIRMKYNNDLQAYLESNPQFAGNLAYKFRQIPSNLNMDRVVFLTTGGSASASELVIVGLEPYMNVIQIGEPTYGKYTGSWVIPDDDEQWGMMPIVLKYENKDGKTDFVDGLEPDIEMDDEVIGSGEFGQYTDPLLARAILALTGQPVPETKAAKSLTLPGLKQVMPREKELMNNLFVPSIHELLKK